MMMERDCLQKNIHIHKALPLCLKILCLLLAKEMKSFYYPTFHLE
jgi:hypothetical protein